MKRRDLIKTLLAVGYVEERDSGDHTVYTKKGCRPITVPRHREVNEVTAQAIIKQAGLK